MAPQTTSLYPWVPNQVKTGFHTINSGVVVGGLFQKQGGQYSFAPAITTPGTVASAGTVLNSTGADCLVYLAAQTGISVVKILSYNGASSTSVTLPGTVAPLSVLPVYVPGPGAIAVSYAGTLNWTWVPV
jgi:hypothetical protein